MVGTWARSALFVGCLVLSGCSTTLSSESTLAKRLADRGPVPLSPDNPFIASNLLLNKEMERSPELKGFIDHRGQPAALEVERSLLGALRMTLFYPDKGEQYSLERVESTWVISGPLSGSSVEQRVAPVVSAPELPTVTPATIATESETSRSVPSAPILVTASRIEHTAIAATATGAFTSPATPDAHSDETTRAALKRDSTERTPPPAMDLPPNRADTLAALISSTAGRTAELSPRGDIVHYVTNDKETLALIAEWYTDSQLNGSRIARMNGRRPNDTPTIGDSIVIPSYLVTNKNRLSEEAIAALTSSSEPSTAEP